MLVTNPALLLRLRPNQDDITYSPHIPNISASFRFYPIPLRPQTVVEQRLENLPDEKVKDSAKGDDGSEGERCAGEGCESRAEDAGGKIFINFEVHLNRPQVRVVCVCMCMRVCVCFFNSRRMCLDRSPTSVWTGSFKRYCCVAAQYAFQQNTETTAAPDASVCIRRRAIRLLHHMGCV